MSESENTPQEVSDVEASHEAVVPEAPPPQPSPTDAFGLVIDVPLRLTVEVGSSRMLLREVLQLGKGAVVDLDRGASDPVDIMVNGRLVARGDLTTSEDRLAVRIVEMVQGDDSSSGRA